MPNTCSNSHNALLVGVGVCEDIVIRIVLCYRKRHRAVWWKFTEILDNPVAFVIRIRNLT